MRGINTIRSHNPSLADAITSQHGFITDQQLPELVNIDRLMLVLVRCGNGRFLCPAQDAKHFIGIIEEHAQLQKDKTGNALAGDHIRDVSLPA